MASLSFLILAFLWILGWLASSHVIVTFIKESPEDGSTRDLRWYLEERLPYLVTVLLVAWPVVCIRIVLAVWRVRRHHS